MSVITGVQIPAFQMKATEILLRLQIKTGMKHSRNAPVLFAKQTLASLGTKPKAKIVDLHVQWLELMKANGIEAAPQRKLTAPAV